jgi:hypothetical protein
MTNERAVTMEYVKLGPSSFWVRGEVQKKIRGPLVPSAQYVKGCKRLGAVNLLFSTTSTPAVSQEATYPMNTKRSFVGVEATIA